MNIFKYRKSSKFFWTLIIMVSTIFFSENQFHAQFYDNLTLGIKAGINRTSITKTYDMIYRPGYVNFTWDENPKIGFNFGGFLNFKPDPSKLAIQPEIYYSQEKFENGYTDVEGLEYTLTYQFNYFQINTLIKYYPTGGLNLGIGPQLGLVSSNEYIKYKSNGVNTSASDELTASLLNQGNKAKNNFQAVFSLGYEFEFGLAIDARYNLGLTDVIETTNGDFGWSNQNNKLNTFQFQLAYGIGINH